MNNSSFLEKVLEVCYEIGYDETPNYSKIMFMLHKILLDGDLIPGGKYLKGPP